MPSLPPPETHLFADVFRIMPFLTLGSTGLTVVFFDFGDPGAGGVSILIPRFFRYLPRNVTWTYLSIFFSSFPFLDWFAAVLLYPATADGLPQVSFLFWLNDLWVFFFFFRCSWRSFTTCWRSSSFLPCRRVFTFSRWPWLPPVVS